MAHDVIMPKIGMYMEDIRLVEWLVDEGAQVKPGELLFTLETDKITSDVEAETSGFLHRRLPADSMVPIGGVVGAIAESREEYDALATAGETRTEAAGFEPAQSELFLNYIRSAEEPAPPPVTAQGAVAVGGEGPPSGEVERRMISPRARAAIAEAGLPPELVKRIPATGPGGRMTDKDVRAFLATASASGAPASAPPAASAVEVAVAERVPLRGRRRVIARRMMESLQSTAQLTSILEIEVGALVAWRKQADPRPGLTTMFVAICAEALRRHPLVNSRVDGDAVEVLADVNVGFAVATEEGVIVPVVRHADRLALAELDARIADLTERSRAGTVTLAELDGGTFTLSNSGTATVDITTAIINPPQAAILWLGRIRERPVAIQGALAVRPTVQACLTYDHRVIDGVPAAGFLGTLEELCGSFPAFAESR